MSNLLEVFGQGLAPTIAARVGLEERLLQPGSWPDIWPIAAQDHHVLKATLDRAFDSFRTGRWGRAVQRFERALCFDSDCLPALLGAACCYEHLGRTDRCLRRLNRAAEIDANNGLLQLARGQWFERLGRFTDARACYEAALRIDERLIAAHLRLAAMHLAAGRFAGAAAHYGRALEAEPENTAYALALAHLLLADGQVDDAIDHFERAITIEPDAWNANDEASDGLERTGSIEAAIARLERAAADQPAFADTHLRLGDLYAKLGREQSALRHYLRAVEIHPGYLEATVKLGTHFLRQGRYYESAEWFNRGVTINDRLLSAYCGLACAHLLAGHDDGAGAGLELAAAIEPNSTLLLAEVARLQLRVELIRREKELLAAVERGDPIAVMDGLVDRQIERLGRICRVRPNHAELHYNLGMLLRHRGRSRKALECFNHAVQISPLYTKAHLNMAIIHRERDDDAAARHHLRRAFSVSGSDLPTLYSLALLALDPARMEQAAARFEAGLRSADGPPDFVANLVQALRAMDPNEPTAARHSLRVWEMAETHSRNPVPRGR